MDNYVFSPTGWIHLVASIIALITGTIILAMKKGTKIHKQIGYVYAAAMLLVVATSFMIYRVFGGFGIFHIAAVVSGITLAGGMIPVLLRKPDDWLNLHFSFMYWSVLGLYMAFVSEILTRIPETPFWGMLGLATGAIGLIGGAVFHYRKNYWEQQFSQANQDPE